MEFGADFGELAYVSAGLILHVHKQADLVWTISLWPFLRARSSRALA
jgi:hypothetical protein